MNPLPRHKEDSIHENGFITAGYLEVLGADADGYKWRKVCANGWTEKDSFVACGQLGFSGYEKVPAGYANERKRWQYGMNTVRCLGTENNLIWCNKRLLSEQTGFHRCPGRKPVVLKCKPGRMFINQIYTENRSSIGSGFIERQEISIGLKIRPTGELKIKYPRTEQHVMMQFCSREVVNLQISIFA